MAGLDYFSAEANGVLFHDAVCVECIITRTLVNLTQSNLPKPTMGLITPAAIHNFTFFKTI